jgi:hypothetical protein
MSLFTLLKQWWWKHRCEFAINVEGCLKPNCPHEPARIAARNPLPKVAPPAPPKVAGFGRYYFESQKIAISVDSNSEVIINAPMDVSVHVVNNTINITTRK